MMYWNGGWSWWAWCLMGGMMLIFWGIVAWVIVTLVRTNRQPPTTSRAPEDILSERYARGEIEHDEYEQRRAVLRGGSLTKKS
jgi:putative membrane protein